MSVQESFKLVCSNVTMMLFHNTIQIVFHNKIFFYIFKSFRFINIKINFKNKKYYFNTFLNKKYFKNTL